MLLLLLLASVPKEALVVLPVTGTTVRVFTPPLLATV